MDSKLGACQVCSKQGKYRCPGCQTVTCSLACSRAHKQTLECDGQPKPVWQQSTPAKDFGWGTLMRDESFLAGVGRKSVDVGRKIVAQKLQPDEKHPRERLDERTQAEWKLVNGARQEGVRLALMPKGMSTKKANRSFWSQKDKTMHWSVHVTFHSSTGQSTTQTHMTHSHVSNTTVASCLSAAFNQLNKKRMNQLNDTEKALKTWLESQVPLTASAAEQPFLSALFLPVVPSDHQSVQQQPNDPRYAVLHPAETLLQALAGRTIVECPRIQVWTREASLRERMLGKLKLEMRETNERKRQIKEDQEFWKRPRIEIEPDVVENEQASSEETSEDEEDQDETDDDNDSVDSADLALLTKAAAAESLLEPSPRVAEA